MESGPLVAAGVDLKDFPFTPIFRARLFGSEFHATTSDAGWRAGVTLWLKSWDQVPAGSLPTDEVSLCRLAELGRDLKAWRRVANEAMRGWRLCSDGRLYHPVVAEGVNDAWKRKCAQRDRTEAARAARAAKRVPQKAEDGDNLSVTETETEDVTGSKGQGQGQGQLKEDSEADASGAETPDIDRVKELWDRGVRILGASSRGLIGKARKQYGDIAVIRAIAACDIERPTDPVSFFVKCLQQGQRNEREQQSGYDILARAAIEYDERQGHRGSSEAAYRSARNAEELEDGSDIVH